MQWRCIAAALTSGACALTPSAARGAEVLAATYNLRHDELVLDIAYRGTKPDHKLSLVWGECGDATPHPIVARVRDANWGDVPVRSYEVRARFSLADLLCRPALLTIGIAHGSFATIYVPASDEFAPRLEARQRRMFE